MTEEKTLEIIDNIVKEDKEYQKFFRKNKSVVKMTILFLLSLAEEPVSLSKLATLLYFSYKIGILKTFDENRCKELLKKLSKEEKK
ncbi:MAG: hypothetical protein ACTSRP_09160 [Candidatus Helarchaeota archaeon]